MGRDRYEILITAPDERFVDKSLGIHDDFDSAIADAQHYQEMGLKVKIFNHRRKSFINLKK